MMALEDMVDLGAVTIGEDVGSTLNHFGNLDGLYTLPNTGFDLRITTKYFRTTGGAIISQSDFKEKIKETDSDHYLTKNLFKS